MLKELALSWDENGNPSAPPSQYQCQRGESRRWVEWTHNDFSLISQFTKQQLLLLFLDDMIMRPSSLFWTWALSQTEHLCTLNTDFQCLGRSHWQNQQNSGHWKYPDGALQTVKKCSVKRWTLLTLNGRHLSYVAEEEEPFRQLFSLESWLTDASLITSTIIAGYNNCVTW